MRSLLVEFHRFNNLDVGTWRVGDAYLVAAGFDCPVRECRMQLDQDEFLDQIAALRYREEADARVAALQKVGAVATEFLGSDTLSDIDRGISPVQLDLVVNPLELAALPFEAATDQQGRPLFISSERPVVLTRRLRFGFASAGTRWPARPRVLYAWAAPNGVGAVPSEDHEKALRAALEPWIPAEDGPGGAAQPGDVLTILPEASLSALTAACQASVDAGTPFTHVHLLAHGYPVEQAHRQRFGMALHSQDGDLDAVTPEALVAALAPLCPHTAVVTVATCDSANVSNTTTSKKSIAHLLHQSGFPIVVASQLPLTVAGSTRMLETFYTAQLRGEDVRLALHRARVALYENQQAMGHDWASLVGYVRLPEGYAEHLQDVRLEAVLASLRTIQARSDKLVVDGSQDAALFDVVSRLLQGRIEDLERFLTHSSKAGRPDTLKENLGLLGSAQKRLAELCWARGRLGETGHWQPLMRAALRAAHDWYRKGFEGNLSNHWAAVQYLSLEAVLEGRIANPGHWHAAVAAAEIGDDVWNLGSLSELHLLAPLAGQVRQPNAARNALEQMRERVRAQASDPFPLESTARQLRRYVDWWTTANGFFPGATDLAAEAGTLLEELRR